jgi:uncharacterized protein (DUF2267 family)
MEQEEILSTLKEKIGNTNLSDKTLQTYVSNNLLSEGEYDDAYFTKHVAILQSLQGQFNHDVASQVSASLDTKVKEYYTKNPEKLVEYIKQHPELLEKPKPKEGEGDSKYDELLKKIEQLENESKNRRNEQSFAEMKAKVKKMLGDDVEVNEGIWEDAVNALTKTDDSTEESLFNEAKRIYSEKYKRYFGEGTKPFAVKTRFTGGTGSSTVVDDFFKRKANKNK